MNEQKIVALYTRVSTGYQIDKDSLPFQKKELSAYCKHILHAEKMELFEDAGKSGKNTDRPAFLRMMKKIRAGKYPTSSFIKSTAYPGIWLTFP